jgi:hypothetical protein
MSRIDTESHCIIYDNKSADPDQLKNSDIAELHDPITADVSVDESAPIQ